MSEELNIELKKPLDKMTAKELRQLVMDQLPMITGASGMTKEELLPRIKEVLGISDDDDQKVSPYKDRIKKLKNEIKEMRTEKEGIEGRSERSRMRKKINKLKKRTRRLAAAN